MAADLLQSGLVVVELDDLPAGGGAVAVAIHHHHGAAVLQHLGQAGVVDLAAYHGHTGPVPGLGIGFALLQLLQRLPEVGEDQVLGAGVAHQVQHVELVAGDDGVLRLAHLADLGDDAADLVVLGHRLADGLVGGVHPVVLRHHVQQADAHLLDVVAHGVVLHLIGHVGVGDEEVGLLVHLQQLKVLIEPVHHGAGVYTGQGVQEVEAALDAPLHQAAGKLAGVVGHVVGGDVDGTGAGGAEPDGEAARHVQQHLRDVEAGVADGQLALRLCLLHQLVVGVVQQIFKVDQMLQISQRNDTSLSLCCVAAIYELICLSIYARISSFTSASLAPVMTGLSAGRSKTLRPWISLAAWALSPGITASTSTPSTWI